MLIRESYQPINQITVQAQLLSLERQANRHRRLMLMQLLCLVIIVFTVIVALTVQPPTTLIKSVAASHDIMGNPVIFSATVIILIAFLTSWSAWMQDLKYSSLSQTFQRLTTNYQEIISQSLPLTAMANDFQKKVRDATQFNLVSLTIVFGIIGGLLLGAVF